MTPDKLRTAGWSVMEWPPGTMADGMTWVAYRKGNPIMIYGMVDGTVVYAIPIEQKATVVRGFRAHEANAC